jgi:hypothetical protein
LFRYGELLSNRTYRTALLQIARSTAARLCNRRWWTLQALEQAVAAG